jgi:putative transposase
MSERKPYPGDLTDAEWAIIGELIPGPARTGRPAVYSRRELLNGILYVARSGCSWRMLLHDLPPWQSGYGYLRQLEQVGLWARSNDVLRGQVRLQAGREAEESTVIVDRQSVKTTEKGGPVAMTEGSA